LLLFRAVVDEWAAVGMNRLAKKSLHSNLSQRRCGVAKGANVMRLHLKVQFGANLK